MKHRSVGSDARSRSGSALAGMYAAELQRTRRWQRNLRMSVLVSLLLHTLLFMAVFPKTSQRVIHVDPPERFVVRRFMPAQPSPQVMIPKRKLTEKRRRKIPLPVKIQIEPEPVLEALGEADFVLQADGDAAEAYAPDPGPLPVGGDVSAPVPIVRVRPKFTNTAFEQRAGGTLLVQTVIDANGDVTRVKILKGLGFGLDDRVVEAVMQWKFRPALRHGQPVEAMYTFTVNFGYLR